MAGGRNVARHRKHEYLARMPSRNTSGPSIDRPRQPGTRLHRGSGSGGDPGVVAPMQPGVQARRRLWL